MAAPGSLATRIARQTLATPMRSRARSAILSAAASASAALAAAPSGARSMITPYRCHTRTARPASSMARRIFACSSFSNCRLLPPLSTISPSLSSTQGSCGPGRAGAPWPAGAAREVADIPLVCQQRGTSAPDRGPGPRRPAGRVDRRPCRSTPCRSRHLGRPGRWCMVKYMFLLYGTSESLPEPGTEEFARMLADWDAATGAMARAGVLIDCAPLQPPAAATTLRVRDGETLLTDGPAAEIKEHFG